MAIPTDRRVRTTSKQRGRSSARRTNTAVALIAGWENTVRESLRSVHWKRVADTLE